MSTEIGRPTRILVADDEPMLRLLARESLLEAGFEVSCARDGVEAMEQLHQAPPDLILLDVKMPKMDGFSVCREVRKNPALSEIPILVMTGLDDFESIEKAYHVGATDFFIKPVNWLVLRHRVEYILRASRAAAEQLQQEKRITQLSYYDASTGLPNRMALEERLAHIVESSEDQMSALLLLDIDRFQRVNEGLGYDVGDRLLQLVGARLGKILRRRIEPGADENVSFLARLGGDEFAVVVGIQDAHQVTPIARRLLSAFEQPFSVGSEAVSLSASIGISLFPQDGADPGSLIKGADSALFRAKEKGRNRFDFYDESLGAETKVRLLLEKDLSMAMEQGELFFLYQPQYEIRSGKLVGVEALMRWNHPELGSVSPGQFIPISEENGFDVVLGEWTVRETARQARIWMEAGFPIRTGLNLSARCLRHPNLVDWCERALRDNGLDASLLEVEITETTLLTEQQLVLDNLSALRSLGIRIALDDFGTGFSALSYLSRFPLDSLKVDRSFISDSETNKEKRNLVSAIVAIGKKLGLRTIAEGIETDAQWQILEEEGCAEAQGFLMSRPLEADAVFELLKSGGAYQRLKEDLVESLQLV